MRLFTSCGESSGSGSGQARKVRSVTVEYWRIENSGQVWQEIGSPLGLMPWQLSPTLLGDLLERNRILWFRLSQGLSDVLALGASCENIRPNLSFE